MSYRNSDSTRGTELRDRCWVSPTHVVRKYVTEVEFHHHTPYGKLRERSRVSPKFAISVPVTINRSCIMIEVTLWAGQPFCVSHDLQTLQTPSSTCNGHDSLRRVSGVRGHLLVLPKYLHSLSFGGWSVVPRSAAASAKSINSPTFYL